MGNLDLISVLTIIGSILTFIITYFNEGQKEYDRLLKEYFEKIVVVYINKYKKQNNINPVRFIKRNFKNDEYFIPSYILYLVKNNNKDELHKVIIEDYKEKFPNNKNNFINTFESISNIISLSGMLFYLVSSIPIVFLIVSGARNVIENIYYKAKGVTGGITIGNITFNSIMYSIISFLFSVAMLIVLIFFTRYTISITKDDYTFNEKKIKKIINKKVKEYNKKHKKYFI